MQPINLIDAAKYFKQLPHQVKAFEYLQQLLTTEQLNQFAYLYRNNVTENKITENNNVTETGERALVSKILQHIKTLGITLDKPPQNAAESDYCVNIIGIEGLNPNFTLNNNAANDFNDLFLIIGINKNNNFRYFQKSVGTTEPGSFYTYNPMNPNGAARVTINTKHEKIWQIGYHGKGSNRHKALVQIGNEICVTRDANKDFSRKNDKVMCGYYGINFHHGYNMPANNIGRASAGCQVIRSSKEHAAAMKIIETDYYFRQNKKHRFSYIILDANQIFNNNVAISERQHKYDELDATTRKLLMDILVKWECGGHVKKYLTAYPDPVHGWKVPTIGIGTIRYEDGTPVKRGDTITEERAYKLVESFVIEKLLPNMRRIPDWEKMPPNKKAALLSFGYNLGAFYGNSGFPSMTRVLQNRQWDKVGEVMQLYVKAGGVILQGLVNRRRDEAALWNKE